MVPLAKHYPVTALSSRSNNPNMPNCVTVGSRVALVLQVLLGGGETRQVVSGIGQDYRAEELVGRRVLVACN